MALRVALVGGPMYDHLYALLERGDVPDVEVVVHADHPTLNRQVTEMLAAGERLDVLATHSKYTPSQAQWLQPLDQLVDPSELAPLAVDLCRGPEGLWCVPRLIDVRIMWARNDRLDVVPDTWDAWAASDAVFGFPGRESGLFGTFFELVVGAGGQLFADDGSPCIDSPQAVAAVELLCALTSRAPADLPDWHYDQVDAALLDGRVDASGVWPGGWGAISRSSNAAALRPHPYPRGSERWVSYAGCHAWAIPTTCGDPPGAVALLQMLMSAEAHALDALGGSVCAHVQAFRDVVPVNDVDSDRLAITTATIEQAMITYPPHARFPELEDAGWAAINSALRGVISPAATVQAVQQIAEHVLTR